MLRQNLGTDIVNSQKSKPRIEIAHLQAKQEGGGTFGGSVVWSGLPAEEQ